MQTNHGVWTPGIVVLAFGCDAINSNPTATSGDGAGPTAYVLLQSRVCHDLVP